MMEYLEIKKEIKIVSYSFNTSSQLGYVEVTFRESTQEDYVIKIPITKEELTKLVSTNRKFLVKPIKMLIKIGEEVLSNDN